MFYACSASEKFFRWSKLHSVCCIQFSTTTAKNKNSVTIYSVRMQLAIIILSRKILLNILCCFIGMLTHYIDIAATLCSYSGCCLSSGCL